MIGRVDEEKEEPVKPKTEEFLYLLLWTADQMMRPTFRNLTQSFEGWAYQNGFLRQLEELERRKLLERQRTQATGRIYRLTEQGRLHVLGGRDPEAHWNRPWDGKWRALFFDLPSPESAARKRLHGTLRAHGFGLLQRSVWISPDPVAKVITKICGKGDDVGTMVSLEGVPCARETPGAMVAQAWDFEEINRRYGVLLAVLKEVPTVKPDNEARARRLQQWGAREREAWQDAAQIDPFLPGALLPRGYLGRKTWRRRKQVLGAVGRLIA